MFVCVAFEIEYVLLLGVQGRESHGELEKSCVLLGSIAAGAAVERAARCGPLGLES